MKKVPFTEMPSGSVVSETQVDGQCLVISHSSKRLQTRYDFSVPDTFPWKVAVYEFEDGLCDEIASGSNPGRMLESYDIERVFLVGLSQKKRDELDSKLAQAGFELVQEAASA